MKKIKSYGTLSISIVLGASALLSGCSASHSSKASNDSSTGPFKGTITMYADQYGPSATVKSTELMTLAKQFESQNPGVTISFVQVPAASSYDTWVMTKASAGQLPDIAYEEYQNIGGTIPDNVFVNLDPYLNQNDPYVKGKTWDQVMNPKIMDETEAPDGNSYLIHGDYVGQGMFYNKTDFKKAGITSVPTTWSQFITDCNKLKSAGITPVFLDMSPNGEGEFTWFSRLLYTNIFANQYKSLLYTGDTAMGTEDQVIAIKKGVFSPSNPKWMEFWQVMKNFATNDLESDPTGVSGTGDLAFKAFSTGQAGMYFGGSWTPASLQSANVNFKWGAFPDPSPVTGDFQYATNFNSSNAVGSPDGQLQYGIASSKADKSMTPAKEKMAVKWLQFITTPKNDSTIVNDLGTFVPTVVGSKPLASLTSLAKLSNGSSESIFGGIDLTNQELDKIFRAFQSYMLGQISLQTFGQTAGAAMTQTANQLISQNKWDLSKYGIN